MNIFRVAMWSGPRNISTAMMRAWENRGDTVVWDEPLYAHYLHHTGLDHPMRQEVISHGETDWRRVVERMIGPVPNDKPVFFLKHMSHHLLDHIDRSWLGKVCNCFLIRDPREVVASYAQKRQDVTLADIGIVQQCKIFDDVCATTGAAPPVIDASEVLLAPERTLSQLCARLGIPFSDRMLAWPAGARPSDGVWGRHWYNSVETSTGFAPYQEREIRLPPRLAQIAKESLPHYERMYRNRIAAPGD